MAPRWRTGAVAAVVLLAAAVPLLPAAPAAAATKRGIHFPVEGAVRFRPGWGDARDGGARRHQGNDLMGERLQRILAATDGTVTRVGLDAGNAGNYLVVRDAAGWQTKYLHLNNDTPGTDDGANPAAWRFAPGIRVGARVRAGQFIAYLGDSGNAETTAPHLHFELHAPSGAVDPWPSLRTAAAIPAGTTCDRNTNPRGRPDRSTAAGWWQAGADGGVAAAGDVPLPGTNPGQTVGLAAAGSGGYWAATRAGTVVAHQTAHLGDLTGRALTRPIVDLAARPAGDGYWLLGGDGGVFSFGAAPFLGSTGGRRLNEPVVGLALTPSGRGYWLVASDGGIFTFGDAGFFGSTGALELNEPIVDVAPTASGRGYWLLGRDGGLFSFGDASWFGSVPGTGACGELEATAIVATPRGGGYWIQAADGRVWPFGNAADLDAAPPAGKVVDLVVLPRT